ncbi:ATP-binding protein [Endozoicomonas ascidiicola]|uniref:ATP-binding protein n=1 Tax=Endozoicomonas ascidiicola TaxID=1698521 RepID=UPI00082CC1BB|nr:ATP-binding protein [Endozoicomonas ascidiicola]
MQNKSNNELILIRGVPGSGKTTKAKKEYPNHVLYEADQYFTDLKGNYVFDPKKIQDAHKWCQAKAKMSLNAGKNVVVANTFTRIWEMKPYLMMAKRLGCQVKVIEATGNYKNVHGVPDEKVEQMRERFENFTDNQFS